MRVIKMNGDEPAILGSPPLQTIDGKQRMGDENDPDVIPVGELGLAVVIPTKQLETVPTAVMVDAFQQIAVVPFLDKYRFEARQSDIDSLQASGEQGGRGGAVSNECPFPPYPVY
jgi:hypothetical protein